MRTRSFVLAPLAAAALFAPGQAVRPAADPTVVTVKMVDKSATEYAFEPSEITVEPGQIVRFVQAGAVPHNVEFKNTPAGSAVDEIRVGPFLLRKGDVYEIRIDSRFPVGTYDYVCTPHEVMGMKGKIFVEGRPTSKQEN